MYSPFSPVKVNSPIDMYFFSLSIWFWPLWFWLAVLIRLNIKAYLENWCKNVFWTCFFNSIYYVNNSSHTSTSMDITLLYNFLMIYFYCLSCKIIVLRNLFHLQFKSTILTKLRNIVSRQPLTVDTTWKIWSKKESSCYKMVSYMFKISFRLVKKLLARVFLLFDFSELLKAIKRIQEMLSKKWDITLYRKQW